MEKQYWNFPCPNCKNSLKKKVRKQDIGREMSVECLRCGHNFKSVIGEPTPAEGEQKQPEDLSNKRLPDYVVEGMARVAEIIRENLEIKYIFLSLEKRGVYPNIALCMDMHKDKLVDRADPKVDENGAIAPGTFTEEDQILFKKMKIDV